MIASASHQCSVHGRCASMAGTGWGLHIQNPACRSHTWSQVERKMGKTILAEGNHKFSSLLHNLPQLYHNNSDALATCYHALFAQSF